MVTFRWWRDANEAAGRFYGRGGGGGRERLAREACRGCLWSLYMSIKYLKSLLTFDVSNSYSSQTVVLHNMVINCDTSILILWSFSPRNVECSLTMVVGIQNNFNCEWNIHCSYDFEENQIHVAFIWMPFWKGNVNKNRAHSLSSLEKETSISYQR